MQQAPYLNSGDSIRIISTARKISREDLKAAIDLFTSWGLKVKLGEHLFQEHHQFSGTVEQRLQDIQNALDDPNCKAIICARGGYGSVQLVDHIDFTSFANSPKWIVGYSDVTVLHNHINQNLEIETIHAAMPINFPKSGSNEAVESLRNTLFGEEVIYEFEWEAESMNLDKLTTAPIVGGNLSILYSLTGTNSQINTAGKYLFMEDLDEYLYHIDRMLMNLKRAGLFDRCQGVLIGGMSDMNDNTIPYGLTAKEIIKENLKEFNIPLLFGYPAGHIDRNLPIIMGREATIEIEANRAIIRTNGNTQRNR